MANCAINDGYYLIAASFLSGFSFLPGLARMRNQTGMRLLEKV